MLTDSQLDTIIDALYFALNNFEDFWKERGGENRPSELRTKTTDALAALAAQRSQGQGLMPNWDDAPEWANWWAMDADGECNWYELEPIMHQTVSYCGWEIHRREGVAQGRIQFCGHTDIPLGIDWRTLIHHRPTPAR